MDKKLTDEEIVKALECCSKAKTNEDCRKLECPFFDDAIEMCGTLNSEQVLISNALDLIHRQKEENERLKKENQCYAELEKGCYVSGYKKIKAQAYKEFAERLKSYLHQDDFETPDERWKPESEFANLIDYLLKELKGTD